MADESSPTAPLRPARQAERQIIDRLRSGEWRSVSGLGVPVSKGIMSILLRNGWIEQRGTGSSYEIKLTADGRTALTALQPVYKGTRPRR
jgi:hypothetical protein